MACYWGATTYTHMALRVVRRPDLTWTQSEAPDYDQIASNSDDAGMNFLILLKGCYGKRSSIRKIDAIRIPMCACT